jgi:hypothetical protein
MNTVLRVVTFSFVTFFGSMQFAMACVDLSGCYTSDTVDGSEYYFIRQ